MKGKTMEIETFPQVVLGVNNVRALLGVALQEEIDERVALLDECAKGADLLKIRHLRECMAAAFSGAYTYRINLLDDKGTRKATQFLFGRKEDNKNFEAKFFPTGEYDTCVGMNVCNNGELLYTTYWTAEELYDMDIIDF